MVKREVDPARLSRSRAFAILLALLMVAAAAVPASAQVGANLSGVVTDECGGALPGVTVTITNRDNGSVQVLVTEADGKYRAVSLQPAPYEVVAELTGFASETEPHAAGRRRRPHSTSARRGGPRRRRVMVSGSAALVEVTASQPSSAVVGDQIASLPVLERNFLRWRS